MHIAICDDNVADRKHLERLLSRESDKRAGTPDILYIDSFGDKEHFLLNPLMYDMIFMDMSGTPTLASEMIAQLTEMGFIAPIILCSSVIDYSALPNLPENVVHINKPYTPDPLPELLKLGDAHVRSKVENIAVHYPTGIKYVPVKDILYYIAKDSSHVLYLKDGSSVELGDYAGDFELLTDHYMELCQIGKKNIVNVVNISTITLFFVKMEDKHIFYISPLQYFKIRYLKEDID